MSRHDIGTPMMVGTDTRLLLADSVRARRRGPPRGERIARDDVVVRDAATLEMAVGPPRSLREDLTPRVAVLHRVGVDDDAGRAFPLRGQRLEPAIAVRIRVADDDDFALRIDTGRAQPIVVLGVAAVGVDDRRGDVTGRGERQPRLADVLVRRVGILLVGLFLQRRHVASWRHHLHPHLARVRRQDVVAVNRHVLEALASQACAMRSAMTLVRGEVAGCGSAVK